MEKGGLVKVIRTARDTGECFAVKEDLLRAQVQPEENPSVTVDTGQEFQQIIGFGGAFTEAAAFVFAHLEPDKQVEVLQAYYHPEQGIGYSLGRTHMNSCDFSLGSYSCAEVRGDAELKYFNIERDRRFIIPMIKAALEVKGGPIKMLISPWSPPAWMKTNAQMSYGGKLKAEYRATWALFYAKFIKAYEAAGIPIWALTVQNEPAAKQTWESCLYTAEEERDFIRDYLGPTLEREGLGDKAIFAWDHNRDLLYERAKVIFGDEKAASYVQGMAFHWYSGGHFEEVQKTRAAFPAKQLLFTEGCLEGGMKLGQWDRGEHYARNMIGDFSNGANGWLDWNLLLDLAGGPNHVANFCDAPVAADPVTNRVYYQSSYYYIGHFSKYVKPGARRVKCTATDRRLETVAFKNPDGTVAVIVCNPTDDECPFRLEINGQAGMMSSPGHSITTYLWNA